RKGGIRLGKWPGKRRWGTDTSGEAPVPHHGAPTVIPEEGGLEARGPDSVEIDRGRGRVGLDRIARAALFLALPDDRHAGDDGCDCNEADT
ncbi:MAG: hypothetical protein M3P24_05510, partial [Gemmatimonadota bacterium]|nr:hypothetical protein [Gemmatimonadota bacterium]